MLKRIKQFDRSGMLRLLLAVLISAAEVSALDAEKYARDPSFQFANNNLVAVNDLLVLPDGRIAVAGEGAGGTGIIQENGLGSWPQSILPVVRSLAPGTEKSVIGSSVGASIPFLRFSDTLVDAPLYPPASRIRGEARKVLATRDGKILGAGLFSGISGADAALWSGLVRLSPDGWPDETYRRKGSEGHSMIAAALDADDAVFASFPVTNQVGAVHHSFGRWLPNGDKDSSYAPPELLTSDPDARITELKPHANGFFAVLQKTQPQPSRAQLVSLSKDGRTATLFGPEIEGNVNAIAFLFTRPESLLSGEFDQVAIGGEFSRVGDESVHNIAALHRAGTLAWTLDPSTGPNGPVNALAVQLDGNILVGGKFSRFGDVDATHLVRLAPESPVQRLFWQSEEYRVFEKLGRAEGIIRRTGKTGQTLQVSLELEFIGSTGPEDLGPIPLIVLFEPNETAKRLTIPLRNDDATEGREQFRLHLNTERNDVLITRRSANFVILDDETPGTVDPHFRPGVPGRATALAALPDGKMLVAYQSDGPRLARLERDGSLDPTFNTNGVPQINRGGAVRRIDLTPEGKIYIVGTFVEIANQAGRNTVARLNADGSLDLSFNPQLIAGTRLTEGPVFALQSDGKVLLHHREREASLAGSTLAPARLNPDASRDTSTGNPFIDSTVYAMLSVTTNEALIGGTLSIRRVRLTFLNSTTIYTLQLNGGFVSELMPHGDHIIAAGAFTALGTHPSRYLARFRASDGIVDTNFVASLDDWALSVGEWAGKLFVSGRFTRVEGLERFRLARLFPNGSLDHAFDPGMGFYPEIMDFAIDSLGRVLVGGPMDYADGIRTDGFVRLEHERRSGYLRLSTNFVSVSESADFAEVRVERLEGSDGEISASIFTRDAGALAGVHYAGHQQTITFGDGDLTAKIVRVPLLRVPELTGDRAFSIELASREGTERATILIRDEELGSVNAAFLLEPAGANASLNDFAIQPDGSILIVGTFNSLNGVNVTNLARLDANWNVDPSFRVADHPVPELRSIAVRPDGRILLGGGFTQVGGSNWACLLQVLTNLKYDIAFNTNAWTNIGTRSPILQILPLNDESVFTVDQSGAIKRFSPNGRRVTPFSAPTSGVASILPLSDDLIAGAGIGLNGFFVMSTNGVIDTRHSARAEYRRNGTALAQVRALAVDPRGGLWFGGDFNFITNHNTERVARLASLGSLNTNFVAKVGTNNLNSLTVGLNFVSAILPLASGDALVGGNFLLVDGQPHAYFARLGPRGQLRPEFRARLDGVSHVSKIAPLPQGDLLVRAGTTNDAGVAVNRLFRINFVPDSPPVLHVLSPTNGTILQVQANHAPFALSARVHDPDGELASISAWLDDQLLFTTNTHEVQFSAPVQTPWTEGQHSLRVVAEDATGLKTEETVFFSLQRTSTPPRLTVERRENQLWIRDWSGQLEESDDLSAWQPVPNSSPNEFLIDPAEHRRFYRAVTR